MRRSFTRICFGLLILWSAQPTLARIQLPPPAHTDTKQLYHKTDFSQYSQVWQAYHNSLDAYHSPFSYVHAHFRPDSTLPVLRAHAHPKGSFDHPYLPEHTVTKHLPVPRPGKMPLKRISLKEAILLALRNNPDVRSSELTRISDKYALEVAHNAFEPQYTLTAQATYAQGVDPTYSIDPNIKLKSTGGTSITLGYTNPFNGSSGVGTLTVEQPLIRGYGYVNRIPYDNAIDKEVTARLNFKNDIITDVLSVITSYRTLVSDYNQLKITRNTLKSAKETVKQYELRYKAGKVSKSDLIQQQAALEPTRQSYVEQQNTLKQNYQSFLSTLGLVPTANLQIDPHLSTRLEKVPNKEEAIRIALAHNIAYRSAIINLRATERAVISARDARKIKLDATAVTTFGYTLSGGGGGGAGIPGFGPIRTTAEKGTTVTLDLDVPIDKIGAKADLVNARIGVETAKLALEQQKEDLVRDVINQLIALDNDQQQIKIGEEAVELKRKTLDAARIKLKYGKTTVFEYTTLRDELLVQENSLVTDRISFLNNLTKLYQTLGLTLHRWDITLTY